MMHLTILRLPSRQVKDGPNEKWSQNIVHDFLEPLIKRNNIRTIITFDGYGVSGHRNHISAHHSVSLLLKMNGPVKFIYSLQSVPLWRKFISAADLPICLLLHKSDEILVAGDWGDFLAGYRAMLEHQTQLIWFRRLYILFSRYMLINSLQLTATLVAK
jgi:N-acetylglucosaminylphosphatidylinositol deacetylase